MDTPENIDEFPETEEARQEAIAAVARYWKKKFPYFQVKIRVPLREVASEPDEADLKATWREEVLDVAVIVQGKVGLFQVFREDPEQTKIVLESIARIINPKM